MPRKAKPPSDDPVAAKIRLVRDALDIKQNEFAKRAGIGPNSLNPSETGKRTVPLNQAIRLAKTYGFSLDWLYLDDWARAPEWVVRFVASRPLAEPPLAEPKPKPRPTKKKRGELRPRKKRGADSSISAQIAASH